MFIDFREKESGVGEEGERETPMWERNIDGLPPTFALTRNQTRNHLLCDTTLQSTQPPGQGYNIFIIWAVLGL